MAQAQPPGICPADLSSRISAIVGRAEFARAEWGVVVQTQASQPQTLYSLNGEKLLVPASNAKLLTTAAALRSLPADFQIRTAIYQHTSPTGQSEWVVVGNGDPSLGDRQLADLAQQIKQRGLQRVDRLILDDSFFGQPTVNPAWEWGDTQADYAPPINSAIVNENAIGLVLTPTRRGQPLRWRWQTPQDGVGYRVENRTRTVATDQPEFVEVTQDRTGTIVYLSGQLREGSAEEPIGIAVLHPATRFLNRLRAALVAQRIQVGQIQIQKLEERQIYPEADRIAEVKSPVLADLVQETNQESNNLYAEVLLRQLGRLRSSDDDRTPYNLDRGLKALSQQLDTMGITPKGYRLVDGSGLARQDWVAPRTIAQVLQTMANDSQFRHSLPIAGVSGTLSHRFRQTPAQGIVEAKTGFLTGAVALSGYITPKQHPPLVFSILLNHATAPLAQQRSALDQIVILLAQLKTC